MSIGPSAFSASPNILLDAANGNVIASGPMVDVRIMGAKCDGVTDDTAAIQAALNLFTSGNAGTASGTLLFPQGKCVISSTLYYGGSPNYALRIVGTTGASNGGTGSTLYWNGAAGGVMLILLGACNTTVDNMEFNGNNTALYDVVVTATNVINTTLGTTVAVGSHTVTPGSMANITVGTFLNVDTGTNFEIVTVTATTGTTFTATFKKAHTSAASVGNSAGSSGVTFRRCAFLNSNGTTSAEVAAGNPTSNQTHQISEMQFDNCNFFGGSNSAYGFVTLSAGNAKNWSFFGGVFSSHSVHANLTLASGSMNFYGTVMGNSTVSDFKTGASSLNVDGVESEPLSGSAFIIGTTGAHAGAVTVKNCSWAGAASLAANDTIISFQGSLSLTNNIFINLRTGSSVPYIQISDPLFTGTSDASTLFSQGNYYQNCPAGYAPFYDGGYNVLLPTYYNYQPVNVTSIGDHGGPDGSLVKLNNYFPTARIVSQGASYVASVGLLAAGTTDTAVAFRNNANTADINGLSKNSSDIVQVGDSAGISIPGPLSSVLNMGSHSINNVADPVNPQDAATKHYVDNAVSSTYTAGTGLTLTGNQFSLTSPVSITLGGTGSSSTSQSFAFIGPTSGSGAPSFRALVATDIPTLNQNTTGYASALASATTTVNVSSATAPSSGQVLTATSSTAATWQTPSSGGGSNSSFALTTATGNGSTTTFTTPTYTLGSGALLVFKDGNLQTISADYTETSTTSVTFNTAPVSNQSLNFYVLSISGRTVTTGNGSASTYTVPSYIPGNNNLLVFNSGILMTVASDYTETSTTSVTFNTAPLNNANLNFIVLSTSAASSAVFGRFFSFGDGVTTSFMSPPYVPTTGAVMVFQDGLVRTLAVDYTETSTTSVNFTAAPLAGQSLNFLVLSTNTRPIGVIKAPTRTVLTSGTSSTYSTPYGATRLQVRMVGGGGAGGSNGKSGTASSFNSIFANPGAAAGPNAYNPGLGGSSGSGTASLRIGGGGGSGGSTNGGGIGATSGCGGASAFGGGGAGSTTTTLCNAASNSGAGGGGLGSDATTAYSGGGAGEYVELIIDLPSASYTYTVGAGGTGSTTGGTGGSGLIVVDEFYW